MNKPYVVLRMDQLTRKKYPLCELFRLALLEGKLVLDQNRTLGKKGIYLKKDRESVEVAFKKNLFRRYSSEENLLALKEELLKLC